MRFLLFCLCLVISSCGPKAVSTGAGSVQNAQKANGCKVGTPGDPKSISELITLINSLPKPLTMDCLLQNLKSPLYVNATSSKDSVQPADGVKSPRIFIFKGPLIISFVPSGEGSKVLEFSELKGSTRSVKGEISLPVYTKIMPAEPFVRISTGGRTSCSGCHGSERLESSVDGAGVYSSLALKPTSRQNVPLEYLRTEANNCAFYKDASERCKIMSALFKGNVVSQDFPSEMPTMLDTFGN